MTPGRDRAASGYRSVPHTADLCLEAWAPTREECLAEAVRGLVASFADVTAAGPGRPVTAELAAAASDDLLAAALDEVIYRMDADDEIPVSAAVRAVAGGGIELRLSVVPVAAAQIVGAVPKAVSLHGLRCAPDTAGRWSASITVDV